MRVKDDPVDGCSRNDECLGAAWVPVLEWVVRIEQRGFVDDFSVSALVCREQVP